MKFPYRLQNALIGATAALALGSPMLLASSPATTATTADVRTATADPNPTAVAKLTKSALAAFDGLVRPLSHPSALEDAFSSYFAYKAAHPNEVKKPLLYFVDYGLPSTQARGYVFDMNSLKIVDGPFTVAHGKGSSSGNSTVPTRFSNTSSSNMTSLGLYVTKGTYAFSGHSAGKLYRSIGLRLDGVSNGFNDNALRRGVVAHGAPYVTPTKAGRSQGCPAMEPARAEKLLPQLANGAMVFLFAPDANWMKNDPWVNAA